MQCRARSAQLGRQYKNLQAVNTEVLVILGDPVERARKYASDLDLPFPVLADPDRQVYHRYGLEKALILIQQSASILVDQNGIIRYMQRATSPMIWLNEPRELIEAARKINDQVHSQE